MKLPGVTLRRLIAAVLALAAVSACSRQEATTPSPELRAIVGKEAPAVGIDKSVWGDVKKFYEARQHILAWNTEEGPSDRAVQALESLRAADAHGLDRGEYGEPELTKRHAELLVEAEETPQRAQQIADFDVRLTSALLHLGRHVATGRVKPATVDARWNAKRDPPDYVAALQSALDAGGGGFLDAVQPVHPEYKGLLNGLASLRGQATSGWSKVPRATLKVGQWNRAVVPLRQRLASSGYLPATAATDSAHYDAEVEIAVRGFQEHHGIKATGKLDPATLTALNVPLEHRMSQVALNLERWRWLPDNLGAHHFMVNIPQYHLIARENGKTVLDIRVVVGKRGNETPTFTDQMTHVVFSPYWNIPESIVVEETAPAIASDPNYLARNNLEVVNAAGRPVPASSVPWGDAAALSAFSFRQRPGARNALGLVKFMFPNRHNVYLHDTPADALFSRIGRAFSHGCIRVEEPEVLAEYVLRGESKWTPEAIRSAMHAGQERHVKLREAIPVHIVYFTAWVDERGGLHSRNDVYGYDARQAASMVNDR